MSDAQTILSLIETCNPANNAKLDGIDARVWCWLKRQADIGKPNSLHLCQVGTRMYTCGHLYLQAEPHNCSPIYQYTRSRDALKAVNFFAGPNMAADFDVYCASTRKRSDPSFPVFYSPTRGTEELAELHAVIRAINFERRHREVSITPEQRHPNATVTL